MAKKVMEAQQTSPVRAPNHPLVRLLIQGAEAKGHTLTELAHELGVTYERFTQWRRGEADIGNAKRSVHQAAAMYLDVPPILILALCRKFELSDFVLPSGRTIEDRLHEEVRRVMQHKFLGGFIPRELADADDSIQLLVVFLVQQIEARSESQVHWLSVLQLMANGKYENAGDAENLWTQKGGDEFFL